MLSRLRRPIIITDGLASDRSIVSRGVLKYKEFIKLTFNIITHNFPTVVKKLERNCFLKGDLQWIHTLILLPGIVNM